MQAIILAAGMGKRLGERTRHLTKAMIKLGEQTLIARALDALAKAGVSNVTVVTGHGADALREHVAGRAQFVHNPIYAETNNIYSLWLAKELLCADDTLLLESDIVFEPSLLDRVVADPRPNLAVVAPFQSWMDGTVTLLDRDDRIVSVVPKEAFDWNARADYWKTVNIYKLSRAFSAEVYVPFLDACITAFGKNRYYEQVLTALTQLGKTELYAYKLEGERWYEIDDPHDLDVAETLFSAPEAQWERYAKRHGGYWRFPHVRDFCYLVNPHFPPPRMLRELEAGFVEGIKSYPSAQSVQSLLAAKLFACEPEQIVVGNGAAELITALMPELSGRVVLPVPTFEEFARGVPADRLHRVEMWAHDTDALVQAAKGAGALVLVNPNNPTGAHLPHAEVLRLCEALAATGTKLVLDESFVDFAGDERCLRGELLARFPHLCVLRSLGKSYGIGGLRLGVLATSDAELLKRCRARLPVWNINSTAEMFLQIVGKFERDYEDACRLAAEDRESFARGLAGVPYLHVLPSRASFVTCEVSAPFSASTLARAIFARHAALIKDCSGKPGVGARQLVRFAVRTAEENAALVEALTSLC